ncbi:hypothetical protein CAPTEDRAFT_228597, partial [Capitella teleta]
MSAGCQKVQVVESEKSPKVVSSNWKEQVLLDRDIKVLQRSEHAVVNKIIIEQKILNKRFNKKIHCAKLAAARSSGDKVLESTLRAKNISVLNTDIGKTPDGKANDPDTQILSFIWERGKVDIQRRLSSNDRSKRTTTSRPRPEGTVTFVLDDQRSITPTTRPVTAVPLGNTRNCNRPKTVIGIRAAQSPRAKLQVPTHPCSAAPGIRAQRGNSSRMKLGSVFGPEIREKTLLDVQRECVKSADYERRVREFGAKVKPLASNDNQDDDYYATKMKNLNRQVSDDINGTESPLSQSLLRQFGSPEVRSLTLKSVCFDFEHGGNSSAQF